MDHMHVRDCFTQVRSIRRLLCQLGDDLGDLTIDRSLPETLKDELGTMQDTLSDLEDRLHGYQGRLEALSRGKD